MESPTTSAHLASHITAHGLHVCMWHGSRQAQSLSSQGARHSVRHWSVRQLFQVNSWHCVTVIIGNIERQSSSCCWVIGTSQTDSSETAVTNRLPPDGPSGWQFLKYGLKYFVHCMALQYQNKVHIIWTYNMPHIICSFYKNVKTYPLRHFSNSQPSNGLWFLSMKAFRQMHSPVGSSQIKFLAFEFSHPGFARIFAGKQCLSVLHFTGHFPAPVADI